MRESLSSSLGNLFHLRQLVCKDMSSQFVAHQQLQPMQKRTNLISYHLGNKKSTISFILLFTIPTNMPQNQL